MLKKIVEVKKANFALKRSVICLRAIDENGKDTYKYLTEVDEFISYLENDNENFDEEEMLFGTYDLLEKESYDNLFLPSFVGEVFSVLSLRSPNYSDYLKSFDIEDYSVDYEEPVYKLNGFSLVEKDEYSLYDSKGRVSVVGVEVKESQKFSVSNFKEDDFKETFGYLYLGEKTGVKFLSDRAMANRNEINDANLGIKEKDEDKFLTIRIMLISLAGNVVDFIAINESDSGSKYEENRFQEEDSVSLYPDIEPYEGSIEEAEDWDEVSDIDDMDEEFDVEIDVIDEINKKDNLGHIDDIDDDIDLGDL